MTGQLKRSAAAAALLLSVSGIASANLITNGGFETGTFSGWTTSGLTCSGVGSNYTAATGGCVGYDNDPGPSQGAYAAYLGTAAGGGVISQSFSTVAGQNYLLEFDLAIGNYIELSTPNALTVQADGNTLFSLLNAPAQGFKHYSFGFVGDGSGTLTFTHGDVPSFFILDAVDVHAVPEPTTLALLGLGIAGIGFVRRRRA